MGGSIPSPNNVSFYCITLILLRALAFSSSREESTELPVGASGCASYTRYFSQDKDAVCLDGSPAVYYIKPGIELDSSKWILFFEGGGWCYDFQDCKARSATGLGTSSHTIPCMQNPYLERTGYGSSNLVRNFTKVHINYCDGGSFAGYSDTCDVSTV